MPAMQVGMKVGYFAVESVRQYQIWPLMVDTWAVAEAGNLQHRHPLRCKKKLEPELLRAEKLKGAGMGVS